MTEDATAEEAKFVFISAVVHKRLTHSTGGSFSATVCEIVMAY